MAEIDAIPYDPNADQMPVVNQAPASTSIDAIPFDPRTLMQRAVSGIVHAPIDIAKGLYHLGQAATVPPDPNQSFLDRLLQVGKGATSGITGGLYEPTPATTPAEAAQRTLGNALGLAPLFKALSLGGKALGLGAGEAARAAGLVMGGAKPLVQGDIGSAVEQGLSGAVGMEVPGAVTDLGYAVGRRLTRGPATAIDLAGSINEAKISNAKAIEATNSFVNVESKANFEAEYKVWEAAQQNAQLAEQRAMQNMTVGAANQIKANEAFAKDITLPTGEQARISPLTQHLENKAATDALYQTVKEAQSKPFELKGAKELAKGMTMDAARSNNLPLIQPLMNKITWIVAGKPNLAQIRDGLKDLGGFVGQENQLHYQARILYKSVFDDLHELGKTDPNALALTKAVASARRDIAARELGEMATNFGSNTDFAGRIKANAAKVDNYLKTDKYMRESFSPGELKEIYGALAEVFKWDKETLAHEARVKEASKAAKEAQKGRPELSKPLPETVPIGKLVEPKFTPGIASRHPAAIPHLLAAGGITGALGVPAGAAYGLTVGAAVFGPRLIFRMAMTPMGRVMVRKLYEGTPPMANDIGRFTAMANFLQAQDQAQGQQ